MASDDDLTVGELARLAAVFQDHRPRLEAMVRRRLDRRLLSRLDVDDILSEAYLVAHRRWRQSYREGIKELEYALLYKTVYQCLVDAYRKETRGKRNVAASLPLPEESWMEMALSLVDTGTSPERATERRELETTLLLALEALSENDRQILWMKYFDGLQYKEIALVLEITETAARVRHSRALDRIRRILPFNE